MQQQPRQRCRAPIATASKTSRDRDDRSRSASPLATDPATQTSCDGVWSAKWADHDSVAPVATNRLPNSATSLEETRSARDRHALALASSVLCVVEGLPRGRGSPDRPRKGRPSTSPRPADRPTRQRLISPSTPRRRARTRPSPLALHAVPIAHSSRTSLASNIPNHRQPGQYDLSSRSRSLIASEEVPMLMVVSRTRAGRERP
jgi:hypothetical protein